MSHRENNFFSNSLVLVLEVILRAGTVWHCCWVSQLELQLKKSGLFTYCTVPLDFSIQLEMPFITKGSTKYFDCYELWEGLLTNNNNFEKPAILKLEPGREEVLELLFVVSEMFCTDVLDF